MNMTNGFFTIQVCHLRHIFLHPTKLPDTTCSVAKIKIGTGIFFVNMEKSS